MSDVVQYLPPLLQGVAWSIGLTAITIVLAVTAAVLVAIGRLSKRRYVRMPLTAYVEFTRSTPFLIQLYYIFYVLPLIGLTIPAIIAGILALTINYTAYLSEVYRAAISAVPETQREAAESLGLSHIQTLRLVTLPQAARIALPPTVNYLLSLVKDTSLLSLITIRELMFNALLLASITFKYFLIFTMVAVIYFCVCYPLAFLSSWVERRMKQEPTWVELAGDTRAPSGVSSL